MNRHRRIWLDVHRLVTRALVSRPRYRGSVTHSRHALDDSWRIGGRVKGWRRSEAGLPEGHVSGDGEPAEETLPKVVRVLVPCQEP